MTSNAGVMARNPSHLRSLIKEAIEKYGTRCSLNHIDISRVQSLDYMFANSPFEGCIARWNTKNVVSMQGMFRKSSFNGDLTQWNVSNVQNMTIMFEDARFNNSVASWNVSKVKRLSGMFYHSDFNGDLSSWRVAEDAIAQDMLPRDFKGILPSDLTYTQWLAAPDSLDGLDTYFKQSTSFVPGMTWWLYLAQADCLPKAVPAVLHAWLDETLALGRALSMPQADTAMHLALAYPMNAVERAEFHALVRRDYTMGCALVDLMAPGQDEDNPQWIPGSTALARKRFDVILGAQRGVGGPLESYPLPSL